MKLTARVEGSARNARDQAARVGARLRSEVERELQAIAAAERAIAAADQTIDAGTRRDALERAVRRLWGAAL